MDSFRRLAVLLIVAFAACSESSSPNPPPNGNCDIVAQATTGNPESAINSAAPGQIVCLVGTFTLAHGYHTLGARNGVDTQLFEVSANGSAEALITVDGSAALVRGNFEAAEMLNLAVSGSNVRLTGFTVEAGFIVVEPRASNVYIENNDISQAVFPAGNAGSIRTLGGTTEGPTDVFIRGNHLHDQYGCSSDDCTMGIVNDWQTDTDTEHHGGITTSGVNFGIFEVSENRIERVTAILYLKRNSGSETRITNNTFSNAQRYGRCRHLSMTFSSNALTNVGGLDQLTDRCATN